MNLKSAKKMSVSSLQKDLKTELINRLPAILQNILLLWRNAPSHCGWAMEKLMELFNRNIAQEEDVLKNIDFTSFLNGFFDMENLTEYPDFVMNNVSIMAAEVFFARPNQSFSFEDVAFKIIRSPFQFWMVNKGHRVDVTFTLYRKFIQQNVKLYLLEQVNFDVDQAFAHALTSSYNYTRKSAAVFFVDLVTLAYQHPSNETISAASSLRLQQYLSQIVANFQADIIDMLDDSSDQFSHYNLPGIVANYCLLMSQCAQASESWCQSFSSTSLFDSITKLVPRISDSVIIDTTDLCRDVIILLLKLVTYSEESDTTHRQQKLRSCLHHLCMINNYITSCDIFYGAGQIVFQKCETDKSLYLELSILPLYVMLGVKPLKALEFCPAFVQRVQLFIESEQRTKPSGLIKESISNLILLNESLQDLKQMNLDTYLPIISYLSLSTSQCPDKVQPLIKDNSVCSSVVVSFIACLCMSYNKTKNADLRNIFPNIQAYARAVFNVHGISFWQLDSILEFYITAISCLCKQAKDEVSVEIMNDILKCLHLKMVAIDSSVRELAVKLSGELYLITKMFTIQCSEMNRSVQAMWKCLEDKADGVACKVLDVLLEIVKAGYFEDFLAVTNSTKENVILTLQNILVERKRDDLKPVAYNLLTKLCCTETLVRYAQVSLQQSSHLLSAAVLEHMHTVFSTHIQTNTSLQKSVDSVMTLLSQGWGDLLLQKVNSQDVCDFRLAVSTIESLLKFMSSSEVTLLVNKYFKDFCIEVSPRQLKDDCKVKNTFLKVCKKVLNAQGFYTQGAQEEISEELIVKKARLEHDETGSNFNMSDDVLQFLGSSMCENAGEAIDTTHFTTTIDDEESYLDSTRDLPPLELSCEPFHSQKCISAMTSLSDTDSESTKLLSWLVFKEIFQEVNPTLMRSEAMRSTDEYVRNSLMVIHDLEVKFEKSLKTCQSELEQELTEFVIKQVSSLHLKMFVENVPLENILGDVVQTLKYLHLLISEGTETFSVIMKQRRSFIQPPDVKGDAFILIKFSDIIKSQTEHKISSLNKCLSLQSILDNYLSTTSESKQNEPAAIEIKDSLSENSSAGPTVDQAANSALINAIISEPLNTCQNLNCTKITQVLLNLNYNHLRDLYVTLSASGRLNRETLKEDLEKLMLLSRRNRFTPLLKYLLGFVKIMLTAILDQNHKSKEHASMFSSTCIECLTNWTTLDEYDDEDDPCALDCF